MAAIDSVNIEEDTKPKEPWLGVCLSFLLPGLGQAYAGAVVRGLVFLMVFVSVCIAMYLTIVHYTLSIWLCGPVLYLRFVLPELCFGV